MSEGLNKWFGLGALAADPEYRVTQGGQGVLKMRLACSERYKDKSGQWQEKTEWVSVVMWGARGESLAKILTKGQKIFVEGKLQTRTWEKDGKKQYATEINSLNVIMCGGGQRTNPQPTPRDDKPSAPVNDEYGDSGGFGSDDDIPF